MNNVFIIKDIKKLSGDVPISGAKNSILGLMAASLLAKGTTIIENVPYVSDVKKLAKIMSFVGSKVLFEDNGHKIVIDNTNLDPTVILKYEDTKELRASYYLMGALLGRFHQAYVSLPGGCNIGCRPVDLHIKGFEKLGAKITLKNGNINAEATELCGKRIYLDFASVGATINIMLASVLAEGTTIIMNSANEPHVIDVANMLNEMGANIYVHKSNIVIKGVTELHPITYKTIPDQIEAGTFLVAGAMMGDVRVTNVIPQHLNCITYKLEEMGCQIITGEDYVRAIGPKRLNHANIITAPYPGFPTDMQPQFGAALGIADGLSIIEENIFENRFLYTDELARLGALMRVAGSVNVITGINAYKSATVSATDLRAGAALVLACLTCGGIVENVHYIDRGYEDFDGKLRGLGANIIKIP